MRIKYPKENKVIRISNKKPEPNRQTLEMENQIEKMRLQIDELETSSISFREQSNNNSGGDTTALQSQITQNANNISSLQSATQTNTSNISALQTAVAGKQDILTAGTNITIENNVISSTASGGSGGMTQEQETKLNQTYNYFLTHVVEPDQNYNPQTFSDYPAGTILQGYAKYKRTKPLGTVGSRNIYCPKMVFTAENNCNGTLNIKISFHASATFNATLTIYNNSQAIYTDNFAYSTANTDYVLERTVTGQTFRNCNIISATINTSYSSSFVIDDLECELIAPNAEIANMISPYNVDYFDGKYYLSDCSSGTAKLAEINVEDMFNMNSITWIDTGIECLQYKSSFTIVNYPVGYEPGYRVDYYLLNKEKDVNFVNTKTGNSYLANICYNYDWCSVYKTTPCYAAIYNNNTAYYAELNTSDQIVGSNRSTTGLYSVAGAKLLGDFPDKTVRAFAAFINSDGDIIVRAINTNNNFVINIGKGTNMHLYYKSITSSSIVFDLFFKYYDKILKKEISYNTTNGFSLVSTQVIGAYEEYFEGANNDYFVVRSGMLEYHKKNV